MHLLWSDTLIPLAWIVCWDVATCNPVEWGGYSHLIAGIRCVVAGLSRQPRFLIQMFNKEVIVHYHLSHLILKHLFPRFYLDSQKIPSVTILMRNLHVSRGFLLFQVLRNLTLTMFLYAREQTFPSHFVCREWKCAALAGEQNTAVSYAKSMTGEVDATKSNANSSRQFSRPYPGQRSSIPLNILQHLTFILWTKFSWLVWPHSRLNNVPDQITISSPTVRIVMLHLYY